MRLAILCLLLIARVGVGAPLARRPADVRPVAGLSQVAGTQPPPGTREVIPAGMTELDGDKNPALIPDHVVWRDTLNFFAESRRRKEEEGLEYLVPLAKGDFDVLYREAALQRGRDEACESAYRAREADLAATRASADATASALDEVLIECRSRNLEAGDRVLDAMSAEGRQVLTTYLERRRRSTSALVPNRELKNFRLPR